MTEEEARKALEQREKNKASKRAWWHSEKGKAWRLARKVKQALKPNDTSS